MVVAALKPQDVQKLTVVKLRAELEKRKIRFLGNEADFSRAIERGFGGER